MNVPEHIIMQSLRAEVDSTLESSDVGSYHLSVGMQLQGHRDAKMALQILSRLPSSSAAHARTVTRN